MRVVTLWWVAVFCVLYAVSVLMVGRALDQQQKQWCASGTELADTPLCK